MITTFPNTHDADHAEWSQYADLLAAAHEAHAAEIRSLIDRLPWDGVSRVLDAPCGDGFYSALIAERLGAGAEVLGVDIDEAALAQFEDRAGNANTAARLTSCLADVSNMPFDDGGFDFVWCAQSLVSLSNPEETPPSGELKKALAEFRRVLKPGGIIALLEQDAMHYLLLPWPAELELAIQRAEREGFRRIYGQPAQLDVGRHLGRILSGAGFQLQRRMSLTADRQGVLAGLDQKFLEAYFIELRRRILQDLSRDELSEFDRLTDPHSQDSFFRDANFEMTWLEFVCLARKS